MAIYLSNSIMPLRIILAVTAGLAAYSLATRKKKVFISYYYNGDNHYKRLLKAWGANKKFSLDFVDVSTDISIKSQDNNYIRRKISEKINQSDVFIVIVGEKTNESEWVSWEIKKALEFKKKIIAIKEKKNNPSPKALLSIGAIWIYGFNKNDIINAIDN